MTTTPVDQMRTAEKLERSAATPKPQAAKDTRKARETELKFIVSTRDMNRVRRLPWLKDRQIGRTVTKSLHATYFDTPELDLFDAKVTFRIRKEGRRWVQCVKTPEQAADGAFTRREWEVFVPRPEPTMSAFSDPECLNALPLASVDRLEPAFETVIKRQHRVIQMAPGQVVALDMDSGEIVSQGRSEAVCEIEMELLEGDPNAVFELALKIAEAIPMHLSSASKAKRGYQLRSGQKPTWVKAGKPELPMKVTAEDGIGMVIYHGITHLRANEDVAINRDHIEGVHQMRVAARRLRSVLSIYRKLLPPDQFAHFNGELKWLINGMGKARDWDVFLDETLQPMARIPYGSDALAVLHDAAARAQEDGYNTVRDVLKSNRYGRLLIELAQWVETKGWRNQPVSETSAMLFAPATTLARQVLKKRHKRLKREGRHFRTLSPEARHQLRIDVKKLRYATEFFSALFPGKANKQYSQALADLQDGLGKLNDVAVAQSALTELIADAPAKDVKNLSYAAGMVVGWQGHVADQEMDSLVSRWQTFDGCKPFW